MVRLLQEIVKLLEAQTNRQIGLIAQMDQLAGAVSELEEFAQLTDDLRSKDG